MDGYAIHSWQADQHYKIVGESFAGHPFTSDIGPGECIRVFTGAVVPPSASQVILQEEVAHLESDTVGFNPHEPNETFIRPVGHDMHAGDRLADKNERLTPFLIGSLAAAGIARIDVVRLPRVGVFSTGDELVPAGAALAPGQIYDSNRQTVIALLTTAPCECADLGCIPDDPERVHDALSQHAQTYDALITTGGVSVGDADYVVSTIQAIGQLDIWKLNLKPGKPFAFGRINQCYFFGLPGNPVSAIVTGLLLTKPALLRLAGTRAAPVLPVRVKTLGALTHSPGREEYQRGTLRHVDGHLVVDHTGDQSSNRLSSFKRANCLIRIPAGSGDIEAGSDVDVILLSNL